MSKYAPLGDYLKRQGKEHVSMTFSDVEKITGTKLPPSAIKYRPWWSNNPKNSVMTKVWLDAGFQTEQVDMAARKLVFRRVQNSRGSTAATGSAPIHPAYGALKGLLRILEGAHITKPADPEWADRLDTEHGREKM
jgi:hypothetical protein